MANRGKLVPKPCGSAWDVFYCLCWMVKKGVIIVESLDFALWVFFLILLPKYIWELLMSNFSILCCFVCICIFFRANVLFACVFFAIRV